MSGSGLNLLKPSLFQLIFRRSIKRRTYNWPDEGIQYPGFKYYPKEPDFQDPPYEPSMLFRVQCIKTLKGRPYWEKHIMKEFKLDGKLNEYVVVKNIPENNARLWKIKHLVKIDPITFPNGFPKDTSGTYLKENGELLVSHKLCISESRVSALEKIEKNPVRMDGDTLRRDSRFRWNTGWQLP